MTIFSKSIGTPQGIILCVDDDDDDAALLESAVNHYYPGISFVKCFGGVEALELLNNADDVPDLILLDVNMPVLNGFECLKEIQKIPRLRDIPVFMISTSASPKDVTMALNGGARRFLTKPNSYSRICDMVNEIIDESFALG